MRVGRIADDTAVICSSKRGLMLKKILLKDPEGGKPTEQLWPAGNEAT